MKVAIKNIISDRPVFLLLLPFFFVLHGWMTNFDIVPLKDSERLVINYWLIALVLFFLSWLLFRHPRKAALYGFLILSIQFFFGPVHDFLKTIFPGTFVVKYSFILPALLVVLLGVAITLKKTKKNFSRLSFYLNTLLYILILIDLLFLPFKTSKHDVQEAAMGNGFTRCDQCDKPDIYLIIADGYPGRTELHDIFGYDNSGFEQELRQRNFHIVDSSMSNYNFTPFSVASMLDMNYPSGITGSNSSKADMSVCYNTIKKSKALSFLTSNGYRFYNYSIFDFYKQNSLARPTFLLTKTKPILSQTFLYRIRRDLGYHLVTTLKLGWVIKNWRNGDLTNNTKLTRLTKDIAGTKTDQPRFVYTHLVMPHYPYYFDSSGNQVSYKILTDDKAFDKKAFLGYLRYANKEYLGLIDHILHYSNRPPIIILMGDHGFREFKETVEKKYHFMNLNAVLIPNRNYTGFYRGQSSVNQFRVLFNSQFGQHLPLLKDSSSFLAE